MTVLLCAWVNSYTETTTYLERGQGSLARVLLCQVAESDAEREELGKGILKVGLRFFHERLEEGGGDVVVARPNCDKPEGEGRDADDLHVALLVGKDLEEVDDDVGAVGAGVGKAKAQDGASSHHL